MSVPGWLRGVIAEATLSCAMAGRATDRDIAARANSPPNTKMPANKTNVRIGIAPFLVGELEVQRGNFVSLDVYFDHLGRDGAFAELLVKHLDLMLAGRDAGDFEAPLFVGDRVERMVIHTHKSAHPYDPLAIQDIGAWNRRLRRL